MKPNTPQFALPFLAGAPEVEQDSADDVIQAVETLIRTPLGFQPESPDYGISDPTFEEGRASTDAIHAAVSQWEGERAEVLIEGGELDLDTMVANIRMEVKVRSDA